VTTLRIHLLASALLLASACAPAAAPPTAPPPKPAAAAPTTPPVAASPAASPKPAAAASQLPAASPAASPAAAPAASPAASPAPSPVAAPTLARPEQTRITIGHAALEVNAFTAEFAKALGLYQKYGLEVETAAFEGGGAATTALVAGQIQAMTTGAPPAIASLATDTPLVLVAMFMDKVTDNLVSTADVRSAADLRGKRVAVSQLGTDSHASVLLALKAVNLTADDVSIVNIGGQAARIAALTAGSVQAAPIDGALEQQMRDQGFNVLVRLGEARAELARSGLVVSREFMNANPNTMLALVAANLEAQQRIFTSPSSAVDAVVAWTQATDRGPAERSVQDYIRLARRDLRWNAAAWTVAKDVQASINPPLQSIDVAGAYSTVFLDRLRDNGFNDAVGVPRT
jgi:NitT/TauT family transport system substrate-binding protein